MANMFSGLNLTFVDSQGFSAEIVKERGFVFAIKSSRDGELLGHLRIDLLRENGLVA